MYTPVPNVVFYQIAFEISGGALKTVLAILRLKKETDERISQSMIAKRMNIGPRSVVRHLQELESLGYLQKNRDDHGMVIDYELILASSSDE